MKALSPDIEIISQKAGQVAAKNYQNWVGTPHLFLGIIAFLRKSKNENDERYIETCNSLLGILTEYDVKGADFERVFLELYPGLDVGGQQFEVTWHDEGNDVRNILRRDSLAQRRQMQVEDLIKVLFSDRSYKLRSILEYVMGSSQKVDEMSENIADAFNIVATKQEIDALEKIRELTNLNRYVKQTKPVIIGADNAVNQIQMALSGKSIKNVILVGPAGTGKTVSVYEFVNRINNKNVIKKFRDKIIYQLDPGSLVAGTRYRGDFEEKLMNIIKLVKDNPQVILFIDEAHMMVKLGDADGAASGGNILKPYITRGEIQMIWTTTDDEYQKHISKDKALERRFHKVNISEPTKEDTHKILKGVKPSIEQYFGKKGSDDLIKKVLEYSEKYTLDQANPAKAINMLELAFANSTVFNEDGEIVFTDDVRNAIKVKYDINISEHKAEATANRLNSFLLGQEKPLERVIENLRFIERGLIDHEKPLVSMVFAGPTGVGKTETAKIIAEQFCGSERNFIKLNMGEFGTEMDVTKITGSAPGYLGHDDETGLVAKIKQYPNSVVLFDEIEKAHPKVFDTLLNILDTGEMTDNHKNRVSFRNAIIIFTTNLGYGKDFAKAKGSGFVKQKTELSQIRESVEKHFRPEFINRIDEIIVFNGLTNDVSDTLIERYKNDYLQTMEMVKTVKFNKTDKEEILKIADVETYGARGLKRAVRKQMLVVLDRMEKELLAKKKEKNTVKN
jgi:ATP-dependent Clp protease ATP-binding subunit ClpA